MPRPKFDAFPQPLVELALFGRAVSHPLRIRVLQILAEQGETAAMDLVKVLPLSQPACSRHFRELLKAGLVRERLRGSNVFYRLEKSALQRFCNGVKREISPG